MASHGYQASHGGGRPSQQQHHHHHHHHQQQQHAAYSPAPMHMGPAAPPGTFAPGTKIQVGSHRVVIQKYLSEGGFAHVYLVKLPQPVDGTDLAVLKRVAVPDKDTLRGMRTEVETMKRLKGHRPIVTYIDSHASEMRGGGYEVFLLMEYCNGGGLIDFMNTRLQHRLTEPEILNIFTDVAEGVACMHYLKPPLLHRDLKVENVLITKSGDIKRFKVCDFGSAANPKAAPNTVVECRLIEEDIQKHTTLQYRSPEMVDVYKKQPIDEKSDIWALGVLLYKLCYYTTPFEDQGQLAILNANVRFPSYPVFSARLKKLIVTMLQENQQLRPNIYEVLKEACSMQGRKVPIKDIYSGNTKLASLSKSHPVSNESRPESTPVVGATFSPPVQQQQAIPEVVPMRRGRPPPAAAPAPQQQQQQQPPRQQQKPNASPQRVNGDPFAALDSKKVTGSADELSSRFPTLDQFDLFHAKGMKFDFDSPPSPAQGSDDLRDRVSEKLADEAFAIPRGSPPKAADVPKPAASTPPVVQSQPRPPSVVVSSKKPSSTPLKPVEMSRAQAIITSNPELQAISAKTSNYVSTGTMTTPPRDDSAQRTGPQIYRFPPSDQKGPVSGLMEVNSTQQSWNRPDDTSSTATRPVEHMRQPSNSSRPSLEGGRPPADLLDISEAHRGALGERQRPSSTHLESNLDFLREREAAKSQNSLHQRLPSLSKTSSAPSAPVVNNANIESNVDFLRSMENDDKKKDRTSKQSKHRSIPSLSGKHIIASKFGDAFKRFESNTPPQQPPPARTPSPSGSSQRSALTPIAGSGGTDGRSYDAGLLNMQEENITPEMRREAERLRLEEEERRVEAAAAEYRQRVTNKEAPTPLPKSIGGYSRAVSIQNRVQSLLQEEQKSSTNVQRTAQGYGHYSDTAAAQSRLDKQLPELPRKPVGSKPRVQTPSASGNLTSVPIRAKPAIGPKPVAPRKPIHLNNIPTGGRPASPPKPAIYHQSHQPPSGFSPDMTQAQKEDYISDFSKRFPSLGALEMVEGDVGTEAGRSSR
ncbi:hypothetical protein jhhlp_006882 [Lomentospora prolificans]|uniref:non-specific serine/threonine protein kinase n=1 Tax=Lomentospora prolificans TaxID=41688 RepID=A0A2N3N308_9PEZI|nr:hypothetical protein jhhlp_006882 [Lomentospora prolificans]